MSQLPLNSRDLAANEWRRISDRRGFLEKAAALTTMTCGALGTVGKAQQVPNVRRLPAATAPTLNLSATRNPT